MKPDPRASTVEVGDEVYAHHPERGPMAVRVLAHGRDGFTGEAADGKRHPLRWNAMLGHKSRVAMNFDVIDKGQEGSIVQDDKGRRRFLAGDAGGNAAAPAANPAHPIADPLMDGLDRLAKALSGGKQVMFLKAGIANRPGLALRDTTDKAGHQTKRWVRSAPDAKQPRKPGQQDEGVIHDPRQTDLEDFTNAPHHKIGDSVGFQHGDVRGEGKIVSSGKDGVTLRDAAGQTHQVTHDALDKPKPAAGGGGGGGGNDGGDDGKKDGKGKPLDPDKLDYPDHRPGSAGADPKGGAGFSAAGHFAKFDAPDDATVHSVLANFPPDTASKMAAIDNKLAGVTETKTQHYKDGDYTPERKELHGKIVAHFLSPEKIAAATPAAGEKPTFTILGGRGGSGKSWFSGKVYDPTKAIVLDADEIKHMLPEYEGWNAYQVHEESGDLFDQITQVAQDLGLNIVHDATMKTPKKAVALAQAFKDGGYRVEAHYMHLPRAEAAKRAVKRFLGPTGRYVPPTVILGNTQNEAAFDQVKDIADAWSFRDNQNRDGSGPTLIAESPKNERDNQTREKQADGGNAGKDGQPGLPAARSDTNGQAAQVPAGSPRFQKGGWPGRALFFLKSWGRP
ncbi:zeta toxin family protein [Rhodovarius crocodyli]|uniref:zeta toxin family protein n=1 Tax=Rhodovarius crocodyli TaxID=1979269 RepID=UPI0013E31A32|nr:zeta toxin family protein [Rhodovarius crocodyli]